MSHQAPVPPPPNDPPPRVAPSYAAEHPTVPVTPTTTAPPVVPPPTPTTRTREPHWTGKINKYAPLVLGVLLALILLVEIIDLVSELEARDDNRDAACAAAVYNDPGGDPTEGRKLTFAEMSAQQRAVADAFDCDVEGR